jgi:DNA ligase-1
MHGGEWDGDQNLKGWWMSEKLDGVRACWNGYTLISKHGKEVPCPTWFLNEFPDGISLDGELWLGRGTLELLNGAMQSKGNELWGRISFVVFDIPISNGSYETRMRELSKLKLPNNVFLVDIERCSGNDHLKEKLGTILEQGGEGLMLNEPNSLYVASRTDSLLKVKVFCF